MRRDMHGKVLAEFGIATVELDQHADPHTVRIGRQRHAAFNLREPPYRDILTDRRDQRLAGLLDRGYITVIQRHCHQRVDVGRVVGQHTSGDRSGK